MEEMPELIDLDQFMTKVDEYKKTVADVASKGKEELLKFKKQENKKINKRLDKINNLSVYVYKKNAKKGDK